MSAEEVEKSIREIWTLFKETDRRMKETDRRFKEIQENFDLRSKEMDQKVAEALKAVADLGGKWGRFVEGVVAPGLEKLFRERGIVIDHIYPRVKARMNGRQMEIDLLAHDGDAAILVEVKSTLSVDDVKAHLKQLEEFKTFFPDHLHRKLYGAVAGIVIEEGADRFAYQQGLFVIAQSGETVVLLNDEKFTPKIW